MFYGLSLDVRNIAGTFLGIIYGVLRTAGLPIEHSDHPAGVIHHPLVPALISSGIVSGTNVLHEIRLLQ